MKNGNRPGSSIWRVAIYIRLSREDGREESRSITEQRKILLEDVKEYIKEDYEVVDVYVDDGLTGTDDNREGFLRMLRDVRSKRVNCVVVKSLSRAFRNYADQGKYLEEIFPRLKVRFLCTGEPFVDSYTNFEAIQHGLEVPINGLLNDRYAAKTSADVKKTLNAKRRRGEFIGAFAPYGFCKDPKNKNRLIIDEEAAGVVRDIYRWFVYEGIGKQAIAKRLNAAGIPNPAAYKKDIQQLNYYSRSGSREGWTERAVSQILKNQVYIGNMVQGRQRTISYKVHSLVSVPEEEWYIVKNTHQPLIEGGLFEQAQRLHQKEVRTGAGQQRVHLYAGLLRCRDCGSCMRRKTSRGNVYFQCRTKTEKGACSSRSISKTKLDQAVLAAIRYHIKAAGEWGEAVSSIREAAKLNNSSRHLKRKAEQREADYQKLQHAYNTLYLDYQSGMLSKEHYLQMKSDFEERLEQIRENREELKRRIADEEEKDGGLYLQAFLESRSIEALERGLLVELIDTIYVHRDSSITIVFHFAGVRSSGERRGQWDLPEQPGLPE